MTPDDFPVPDVPVDFVDRVMAEVERERARARAKRSTAIALVAAAAVAALGFGLARSRAPRFEGDLVAEQRVEVEVGPGVRAVLERAAHVAWGAAGVTQDRGDVFYRLAPGASMNVHTPAGDIASDAGSCSRVRVDPAPTATGSPVTFVSVSQGKIAVRRDGRDVWLDAGRYARFDAASIRTDAEDEDGALAYAFVPERARSFARRDVDPIPTATATIAVAPPPPPRSARPKSSAAPSASAPVAPPPPASTRPYLTPRCVCLPNDSLCDCP